MFIVLIDIKALILNQTVTQPLVNILRLIDLSTAYKVWNWLQLAIDLYKVPILIIIPIKTIEVYYNAIAVAILQANGLVSVQGSIVDFIVSSKAISRCISLISQLYIYRGYFLYNKCSKSGNIGRTIIRFFGIAFKVISILYIGFKV